MENDFLDHVCCEAKRRSCPGSRRNKLEILLYLERHLRNPTSNYRYKTIKRRRGIFSSQIKCWTRWKDIWIILQQRPHKRLQMEARSRNWLLVWRPQLILSPDSSKKSSVCQERIMLSKIREHPPPAGLHCKGGTKIYAHIVQRLAARNCTGETHVTLI